MSSDKDENKPTYGADVKSVEGQTPSPEVHTSLHRKLKNRHVAMISIGSVIGTGIFLGTANSLRNAGPLGLLLAYIFIGTICLATMLSLGEMIAFLPLPGGFIKLAERYIDPAYAFAIGWNYWYGSSLLCLVRLIEYGESTIDYLLAELSAAATLIGFWDKTANPSVYITMCLIVAVGINVLGVGVYGETEFWFCSIKVITIVGVIMLGIIVDLGGGPDHDRIGFRYWKNPGLFAVNYYGFTGAKGHFLGTFSVVISAAFAYRGTEVVAMAAAEVKNPRRNVPKAIKRVYFRILVFYIGSVLITGLLVPSNYSLLNVDSKNAADSPFVIAFNKAGIKTLPSIINIALITSAWSAASGDIYVSSRCLYGLAASRSAPKFLLRTTTRTGLPYISLAISSCCGLLAYLTLDTSSGIVFTWLSDFSSTTSLLSWFSIGVIYLRFYKGMKVQGIDRRSLPFAPNVQPFAAWYCVIGTAVTLFFSAWPVFLKGKWSTAIFVTNYFPILFFPVMYITARLVMSVSPVQADEMDFVTNVVEFDAITYEEPPPKNKLEAFWMWLM